jgi:hypothetical protein
LLLFFILLFGKLSSESVIEHPGSFGEVDKRNVAFDKLWNAGTDVINMGKCLEERNQFKEAAIIGVVIPAKNRHSVLRMKKVGVRRIINYYNVFHRPAQQWKVLYVRALEREAVLAVQAHRNQPILVQSVDERVSIYVHRSRVEHDLVDGCKFLNEKKHARPNQDVDLNWSAFDNNPHLKITLASGATLLYLLKGKLAVDERFIEVEDESLAAEMLRSLVGDHGVFSWHRGLTETACSVKLSELVRWELKLFFQKNLSCLSCHLALPSSLLGLVLHLLSSSIVACRSASLGTDASTFVCRTILDPGMVLSMVLAAISFSAATAVSSSVAIAALILHMY